MAPDAATLQALSAIVAAKPYARRHYWLARKVGRFIDADLLIACGNADLAQTDQWRADLEADLRSANWQLHDLVIAFGRELPTGKQEDWLRIIPFGRDDQGG